MPPWGTKPWGSVGAAMLDCPWMICWGMSEPAEPQAWGVVWIGAANCDAAGAAGVEGFPDGLDEGDL